MACDFLHVNRYNKIVLAQIDKERILDAPAIKSLSDDLLKLVDTNPKISLVLDMSKVGYLSSQVLGKLVAVHKQVLKSKGRLAVCGVQKNVRPLFEVTKLNKVLTMFDDAQEAILLYQRKPL